MGSLKLKKVVIGILVALLAIILAVAVAGIAYEQIARSSAQDQHPPSGQLVGTPAAHLYCIGDIRTGSPTVILEAGLDLFGSLSWSTIQTDLSHSLRVCSYDRPGIMWSAPATTPRDANHITQELRALLAAAGENPPYLLVGHSLGGLFVQVYAARYPDEVQGLVLVDSSHPKQDRRLPREAIEAEMPEPPPDWLISLFSQTGALRLLSPFPERPLPASVTPALQFMSTSVAGLIGEARQIYVIAEQAEAATLPTNLPIYVISRGKEPEGIDQVLEPEVILEVERVWRELQSELANLSACGQHETVPDAGHYVHHDTPDTVIRVIQAVAHTSTCASASTESPGD